MKKVLFIDRDGTLIREPADTFQVNSLEELYFLKNVISSLKDLYNAGFKLVIVTNQDGLGTASNPRENYEKINQKMFDVFGSEGVRFSQIFECPHFERDNCLCRKPKRGILGNFLSENVIDYNNSYVIGDRDSDMEFAKNIGVKGMKVNDEDVDWVYIKKRILGVEN